MKRILRAVKALLGIDSFGLKEAEKIHAETREKFSPEEARIINFGVVRGAEAMGHRVTITSDAKREAEEKKLSADNLLEEARRVAEAKQKKEEELLRKARLLRLQAEAELESAARYGEETNKRIKEIKEVEKAFTF